ncbi:hypothetical protein [Aminobacter carboxidus]|uniref:hypothetical protein n=1 Tax=Aminobacter carboxidus TaxID=376165 RepID=UPI001AEDA979|nr:hypothetical protein [Aminobacter carboxidus]
MKTDCAEIAQQKAARVWNDLINAWDAKLAEDAERAFAAAYNLAQARGFRWLSAEKVATLPRAELLERIEAVTKRERHS